MKVICISGHAQHGKDTVAKIMKEMLQDNGYRVLITHYADLVKFICRNFFGWDGNKDENGRHLLQFVGTDVVRKQNPDYWVDFIADMLTFFGDKWDYVLIPDTRFPNEIEKLRKDGFSVEHVHVSRPNFDNHLTEEQKNHPSETALDETFPDALIVNSGDRFDLVATVGAYLHSLGIERC